MRTTRGRTSRTQLYYPLEEPQLRLIRIVPQPEGSTIRCRLSTVSLLDVSDEFNSRCMKWTTDGERCKLSVRESLRDPALRKDWTARSTVARLAPMIRIASQHPYAELHRFVWGDFASLSYVWGDQADKQTIYVDNQPVQVTKSLERALQEFRREGLFSDKFMLWVDALCINQDDLLERAVEVQRMKDIYSASWSVVAWLGEATANSGAGLQLVKDLAAFREAGCELELERRLRDDPRFLGGTCWLGLQQIVNREYWSRLWIIQEIVMGGTNVRLRCGASTIDWPTFCAGIATLQERLWLVKDRCLWEDVVSQKLPWSTRSLHLIYQDLSIMSATPIAQDPKLVFARLLDLANATQCIDDRDKVYALLGLVPDQVARLIQPDYNATSATVYTNTARAFIDGFNDLEPLREGNPWGPTGCPSWVADWKWDSRVRHSRVEQLLWGPTYLFPNLEGPETFGTYTASGKSSPQLSFSNDGLQLHCQGFIVDTISGLSAAEKGYFEWYPESIVQPRDWRSAYGGFEETSDAIMRTLVSDRVRHGHAPDSRHRAIFHLPATFDVGRPQFRQRGWSWLSGQAGYYFRWEGFREAIDKFQLGEWCFGDFFDDDIPYGASEYDYTEVYACAERSGKRRRFMTTAGGLMGWAPSDMYQSTKHHVEVGDQIAIVLGCSTPLAVRPIGDAFQVLGEAFVQGLMDGQAIERLRAGTFKIQTLRFK
ncbi:hypothetical protein J4E82_011207 [Alternaria postmessia]|uniref:uncharacterized protein n=1 Tax=Alternaria postmessia TaxID=1187938 RepID=UPI0022241B9B|nr:uncharacterized protein J4E82_011207 [Alternaria postmessia]KAI5365744.1 hypothetical protein J4E82_011207 [Alternaria postmessia]